MMDFILMTVLVLLVAILLWALSGAKEKPETTVTPAQAEADKLPPEQTFRRRARDKEIEEETSKLRRREDQSLMPEAEAPEEEMALPYSVDEIIPESSRLRFFRRTLLNSEAYARRGDFTTAISLYEGVKHRIADMETKYRIDSNIEYLTDYRQHRKEELEQRRRRRISQPKGGQASEVKFSIDGQVPQVVNIGVADTPKIDPEKIADMVSRQLRQELDSLRQDQKTDKTLQNRVDEQLAELKAGMEMLNREKNRALEELDRLKKDKEHRDRDEIERLRNEIQSINSLKNELNELNKKLLDSMLRVPEVAAPPVIPEARFTLDPRPILDILEKIPKQTEPPPVHEEIIPEPEPELEAEPQPEPEALTPAEPDIQALDDSEFIHVTEKPQAPEDELHMEPSGYPEELRESDLISIGEEPVETAAEIEPETGIEIFEEEALALSEKTVEPEEALSPVEPEIIPETKAIPPAPVKQIEPEEELRIIHEEITQEKKEEDDFELVKELGREDQHSQIDELSDEEIFERILKDTRPQKQIDDGSFEIVGDRREEHGEIDYLDREQEEKRREEEDFYRKFLKSDKMKKKELPILKVTYDFTKLPHDMSLSKEKNIVEYSFYKYRPMLEKADEFIKKRKVKDAINYYKVVMGQNIPPEFKAMLRRNINDLTDYLERYLTGD